MMAAAAAAAAAAWFHACALGRYAAVRACRWVSEVIEDAPLVTDEAFIKRHNIHLFAIGEEYYDDPNDKYYTVPRALGMLRKTRWAHSRPPHHGILCASVHTSQNAHRG